MSDDAGKFLHAVEHCDGAGSVMHCCLRMITARTFLQEGYKHVLKYLHISLAILLRAAQIADQPVVMAQNAYVDIPAAGQIGIKLPLPLLLLGHVHHSSFS